MNIHFNKCEQLIKDLNIKFRDAKLFCDLTTFIFDKFQELRTQVDWRRETLLEMIINDH